jgi:hypothetical protein
MAVYILDALKKAKRERDLRQILAIRNVHEPGSRRRNRTWPILLALALCVSVAVWFIVPSLKKILHPGQASQASQSSAPLPASQKTEFVSEKTSDLRAGITEISGAIPGARPSTQRDAIAQPNEEEEVEEIPPAERIHGQARPVSAGHSFPITEGKHDSKPAQAQPASLRESLRTLNLTLLYYSDAKAERIVFINGKKYVEGDYIEGSYLLESITSEGAILSYQNERTILKLK